MEHGIISKEFFIGRYIYITKMLKDLPEAVFNHEGEIPLIAVWSFDPETGKKHRDRRIRESNPEYAKLKEIALKRLYLEKLLRITLKNWSMEHSGNLGVIASEYTIIPNMDCIYDSTMWMKLKNNSNKFEKERSVMHNGILMRSQFEADVANILEELGIEYKYEVGLTFNSDTYYPDFAMNFPEYNRCSFLEALGGMDNFGYVGHNAKKLNAYFNSGLYPNRDIAFISGDYNYRPDHDTMKRIIGVMLDAMARQYVVKKTDRVERRRTVSITV